MLNSGVPLSVGSEPVALASDSGSSTCMLSMKLTNQISTSRSNPTAV
jgi:hypothetical protein